MLRSRRFVLTPFCMLCQGVRAEGIVRHFPSIIKPVVDLLAELKINIIQMPCPELLFDSFHRKPCGKPKYDNPHNRAICRKLAEQVVAQIEMFKVNGCTVEAVLGVEFSPSCAVTIVAVPPPKRREVAEGIYTEELKKVLHEHGIKLPFVGIEVYHLDRTLAKLREVLGGTRS